MQLPKASLLHQLLSCGSTLFVFFPRALHVLLHLGQMFKSVCLIILPGTQEQLFICPSSTWSAGGSCGIRRATSVPANGHTWGKAPHSCLVRQAVYRLLSFKPQINGLNRCRFHVTRETREDWRLSIRERSTSAVLAIKKLCVTSR